MVTHIDEADYKERTFLTNDQYNEMRVVKERYYEVRDPIGAVSYTFVSKIVGGKIYCCDICKCNAFMPEEIFNETPLPLIMHAITHMKGEG